jgi:hypothetical protein
MLYGFDYQRFFCASLVGGDLAEPRLKIGSEKDFHCQ